MERRAAHSEAKSERWVSVHEDVLVMGSSVDSDWDRCNVAARPQEEY